MDTKLTKDLMQMLDFSDTVNQLEKDNSVRWYGHALSKNKNTSLRGALEFDVEGTRKMG